MKLKLKSKLITGFVLQFPGPNSGPVEIFRTGVAGRRRLSYDIRTLKGQKRSKADGPPSSAGGRRQTQDVVGPSSFREPCLEISFLLKAILFKPNQPNELFDLDLADLDDLGLNNDDEIQEIKKSKERFQCQPITD